jgi:hypothetical protein
MLSTQTLVNALTEPVGGTPAWEQLEAPPARR